MRKTSHLEPGIYFGLSSSIYHADDALSRTNLLALNDTAFTYWEQSWMNPHRREPKPPSDEMMYGDAFHCLLFEPRRFERDYYVFPVDRHDGGRIRVPNVDYEKMVAAIKVLRAGRDSNLFLSGGMPEVTIVFDYEGLRFRARHDYLTPVCTVDFKTTFSLADWHLKKAFDKYGYDIQMALYKLSRQQFKQQFDRGRGPARIHGKVDAKFMRMFLEADYSDFVFIFQRESAPFPFLPLLPEEDTEQAGMARIDKAIRVYKANMEKFGTKEWEVCDGRARRFSMMFGVAEQ